MEYLVEMTSQVIPGSKEEGLRLIKDQILPTLEKAKKLRSDLKIVAGGPVAGQVALAMIINVDSPVELDLLLQSLPVWPIMKTTVTPLVGFEDRETAVLRLLETLQEGA